MICWANWTLKRCIPVDIRKGFNFSLPIYVVGLVFLFFVLLSFIKHLYVCYFWFLLYIDMTAFAWHYIGVSILKYIHMVSIGVLPSYGLNLGNNIFNWTYVPRTALDNPK